MSARWRIRLLLLAMASLPSPASAANDLHGDPLPPGAVARLGTTRFRSQSFRSTKLAFSPDGQMIVGSGEGHALRLWDSHTGRLIRDVRIGRLNVTGFALSPDGKLAAVGGYAIEKLDQDTIQAIHLVEIATGKVRQTLSRKDREGPGALAFTPDGKHLASIGDDGIVRIEEVETGTELLRERFRVRSARLAFSADGKSLAVGGWEGAAFVWDWQSGKPPREIEITGRFGNSVSFSPDGKTLATGDDGDAGVRLYDISTGKLSKTLKPAGGSGSAKACFSPDGRFVAASSRTPKAVVLWDAKTGKEVRRIALTGRHSNEPTWSSDSRRLAVVDKAVVRVFEASTGKETPILPEGHENMPGIVALLADGTAMTAGDDGTVRLWDSATGKHRRTVRVSDDWVRGASVSPDGRWLAASTLSTNHAVTLWDLKTGKLVYRLLGHGRIGGRREVAFSSDSKRFLTSGEDLLLRTWDVRTGKAVDEWAIRPDGKEPPDLDDPADAERIDRVDAGTLSPGGGLLVLGNREGFFAFDAKTGKQVRKIDRPQGMVMRMAVAPDGKSLLTSAWGRSRRIPLPNGGARHSSGDGVLTLHDLTTGKLLHELKHPLRMAGPVGFSADGKLFAAACWDQDSRISFYDTATGAARGTIDRVPGRIWSLGLSPDGNRVIVGMDDTTALVYDVPKKANDK